MDLGDRATPSSLYDIPAYASPSSQTAKQPSLRRTKQLIPMTKQPIPMTKQPKPILPYTSVFAGEPRSHGWPEHKRPDHYIAGLKTDAEGQDWYFTGCFSETARPVYEKAPRYGEYEGQDWVYQGRFSEETGMPVYQQRHFRQTMGWEGDEP